MKRLIKSNRAVRTNAESIVRVLIDLHEALRDRSTPDDRRVKVLGAAADVISLVTATERPSIQSRLAAACEQVGRPIDEIRLGEAFSERGTHAVSADRHRVWKRLRGEGFSAEQIAKACGCNPRSVTRRLTKDTTP
jgi:RNase P/RNase MRP subunit p30